MLSLDPAELATAAGGISSDENSLEKSSRQTRLSFVGENKGGIEGLIIGSSGYGFRFSISNLTETTRSGRKLITLKYDDRVSGFSLVTGDHLFMASENGKGIVIPIEQISLLTGAGMGSRLIKLVNSRLVGFKIVKKNDAKKTQILYLTKKRKRKNDNKNDR